MAINGWGWAALLALQVGSGIGAQAPAQERERWQLTLRSSEILYELRPVRLEGDDLVLREGPRTISVPLREITELRRVVPSPSLATGPVRRTPALTGADDLVLQMTLLEVAEKRALVRRVLQAIAAGQLATD